MNDVCEECGVACQKMLTLSAVNAFKMESPNPAHCLCVALIQAVEIMHETTGEKAALSLAAIILKTFKVGLKSIFGDDDEEGNDKNHVEVWN